MNSFESMSALKGAIEESLGEGEEEGGVMMDGEGAIDSPPPPPPP